MRHHFWQTHCWTVWFGAHTRVRTPDCPVVPPRKTIETFFFPPEKLPARHEHCNIYNQYIGFVMQPTSAGHFPWQSFLKKTNKPHCVVWTFWNPTIPLVYHWFPLSIGVSRLWRKHANIFWTTQSFPRKTIYFHSYVNLQQGTSWGTWWCWGMGWNGLHIVHPIYLGGWTHFE